MIKFNKKIKNISILGLFLLSSLFLTSFKIENDVTILEQEISRSVDLKASGFWSNFTYIHVKDNWTDFPIIDGDGSWSKPYTIENMTIDATTSPTGSGILIEDSKDVYFKIKNCTISNWGFSNEDGGIKLINSSNGIIENNTCSGSSYSGIVLMGNIGNTKNSNNNTIIGNTVNNNGNRGIFLEYYCENNTIADNDINGNTAYGIDLWQYCSDNTIKNNDISGNGRGINVQLQSNLNMMKYNRLENNGRGIYLFDNCYFNYLINNTIRDSTGNGIFLETSCESNSIARNYLKNNGWSGIELVSCDFNIIIDNIIIDNWDYGINLDGFCDVNNIRNNTIKRNGNAFPEGGIVAWNNCHNNLFTLNIVENNWYYGIHIGLGDGNLLNNNTIKGHVIGLRLYSSCDSNTIVNNSISQGLGSTSEGIVIEFNCINNVIQNNFINDTKTGIRININVNNTDITENIITNCDTRGIQIQTDTCDGGEIWLNRFVNNSGENARDDSGTGDTSWDKGGFGNYWDDYNGFDCNSDGIGETPYTNIFGGANSQDNYPLWTIPDTDDPLISENNLNDGDLFGTTVPIFNLDITDYEVDQAWYSLWDGIILTNNYTFTYNQGIDTPLSQSVWNEVGNGTVTISFYANDTCGNENFLNITIKRDILAPMLSVLNPLNNSVLSITERTFNYTIQEGNLDSMWYSIAGGQNHFFTLNGTFDQFEWETVWNATAYDDVFVIIFYANDTLGNFISLDLRISPDKPAPSNGEPAIPFGNYFMIYGIIAIVTVVILKKRKINLK